MTNFEATAKAAGDCHYTIDVKVPAIDVAAVFRKTRKKVKMQARLPGFRPGKAPEKLIEKRFGQEIREEVQQELMRETLPAALKDRDIAPLTYPRMKDGQTPKLIEGEDFTYIVEFDVRPEFELPTYDGLELERYKTSIDEDHIDKAIRDLLESRSRYDKVESAAVANDLLKVGYSSNLADDEEVPDAAARMLNVEETWLLLAEPEMIPGIATGLLGVRAGDEKELEVHFPEDYYEPFLCNKTLTYKFQIMEVHSRVIPELNDELAQELGAESVENMRKIVREQMENRVENAQKEHLRSQVVEKLLKEASFPLPPLVVEAEIEIIESQLGEEENNQAVQRAIADETADDEADPAAQEALRRETATAQAQERLRLRFMVETIAKAENISVQPTEIRSLLSAFLAYHGLTDAQFKEHYDESAVIESIHTNTLHQKVLDALIEKAKVTEIDPPKDETAPDDEA